MKKQKIIFVFTSIIVLTLMLAILLNPSISKAGNWLFDPEPAPASSSITLCIGAKAPNDGWSADDYLDMVFPSEFDLTGLTISDTSGSSEIELYSNANDCTGTARIAEATATADNDRDYMEISGQQHRIILEDAIAADTPFSVKYVAKSGDSIVTPSAGKYLLKADWGPSSTFIPVKNDADFIYVGDSMPDQVEISASVDPSLTLSVSSSSCNLGTFSATNIQTCNYYTEVSTNASSGYTAYIKDDGDLSSGSDTIADVTGGSVSYGTAAYGISTTEDESVDILQIQDADSDLDYDGDDCSTLDDGTTSANASAVTTSDQSFATSTGAISADSIYLCHAAAISGSTPAGAYSNTITITAVGNF